MSAPQAFFGVLLHHGAQRLDADRQTKAFDTREETSSWALPAASITDEVKTLLHLQRLSHQPSRPPRLCAKQRCALPTLCPTLFKFG